MSGNALKNAVLPPRVRLQAQVLAEPSAASKLRLRLPRNISLAVLIPVLIIATIAICALVPGWIAPFAPTDMDDNAILAAPSLHHLFGTDQFGRDICSMVIFGAQRSLEIALFSMIFSSIVGTSIGLVSGFAGGWVDMVLMRLIDIWMSVPRCCWR